MMEGVAGILDVSRRGCAKSRYVCCTHSFAAPPSQINSNEPSAKFLSGTIISDINQTLAAHSPPLALRSLGSISEQTIGGLISTATHGSGIDFPCVSAYVTELEIILPLPPQDGGVQIVHCSRQVRPDLFNASLCGLGATGLIVTVKMDIDPAFRLRHLVEEVRFDDLVGPAALVSSQSPAATPLGKLLAHGQQPLPPPRPEYLPHIRQSSPSDIWPSRATEDEAISRVHTDDDDDDTRQAQKRLDAIVRSAQHTRLWYFPHVGMATLSRANRTLDAPVATTWGERAYASVVGYHFTQFLLYVSRYHHSLPPRIGRVIHYLTHPAFPRQAVAPVRAETQPSTPPAPTNSLDELSTDFTNFTSSSPSPTLSTNTTTTNDTLKPLQPHHPHSITTDHSWKIFNMDCLFPQYTTEWSIPFEHTAACLRALRDWLDEERALSNHQYRSEHFPPDSNHPRPLQLHMPLEIRFTSADGIWLSHGYGRLNTYIGLITYRPYNTSPPYRLLFRKFENLMRHFAGRPHWAKEHTCGVDELRTLYPHFDDWRRVREQADPEGVLVNAYVGRHLLGYVGEEYGSRVHKKRERGRLGRL